MIQSVTIQSNLHKLISPITLERNKLVIDCAKISESTASFNIEIEFNSNIVAFRNHDYTWVDVKKNRIATEFSPKIIKLENGTFIQPDTTRGIWETHAKNTKILYWKFNPEFSKPITKYTGTTNSKTIFQANSEVNFTHQPTLLFTKKYALEISRSKIPFTAIACFTDHCDFDTAKNLKTQRSFFKEKNIKTTKGFFLNHFSKRADNASYENDKTEIESWKSDGHELCYHSLSQSIKSQEDSFYDFKNFTPPFSDISVWIDHGYQSYNFSLFEKNKITNKDYESILHKKNIKILWNYIDSGTTTKGVINQLNPNHFTLKSFFEGNKNLSKLKLAQSIIKNIVFHYLNNDKIISKYKATALNFKKIVYQKEFKVLPRFLIDFIILFKSISQVLLFWNSNKNKSYKLSIYTPLFFNHTIDKKKYVIFQTLEMIDFETSLSKKNIDLLIQESGIFIAHTYFSDNINYHNGKLLTSENKIDLKVNENFSYLAQKIQQKLIWNPNLSELYAHLKEFENCIFDVDENGTIFVKNKTSLAIRTVN